MKICEVLRLKDLERKNLRRKLVAELSMDCAPCSRGCPVETSSRVLKNTMNSTHSRPSPPYLSGLRFDRVFPANHDKGRRYAGR